MNFFSLALFSAICVEFAFQHLIQLKISNSSDCIEHEFVDYYMYPGKCIVSVTFDGGSEMFIINGSNITHNRFNEKGCNNQIDSSIYEQNVCFVNFTQEKSDVYTFYYFNITNENSPPFDFTVLSDWTTLSYYTDDDCSESLFYSEFPGTNSYRLNSFTRLKSDHHYQSFYCNSYDFLVEVVDSNNHTDVQLIIHFRDLVDNECSNRIHYSFLRERTEFRSFVKKCRGDVQILEEEITSFDCPNFQLEDLYFTESCDGIPFGVAQSRLKQCNGLGKKFYNNNTHQLMVRYSDYYCQTGVLTEIRFGKDNSECRPLSATDRNVNQPWGYTYRVLDDPYFSEHFAMILTPGCGYYSEEEIEYIKRTRSHQIYYISEDHCVREDDWNRQITIGGAVSLRGRCENGMIHAKNYTLLSSCENINIKIEEDFCTTNANGWGLYFTCIPYYCDSLSEYDRNICNGHGLCRGTDKCECKYEYSGTFCEIEPKETVEENESQAGLVFGTVFGSLVFMLGGTTLIISCLCCTVFLPSLLCVLCLGCCITLGMSFVIHRLRKKQKKFKKLRNIDILLKEQELDDDTSIAHLRIKNDLFQISFDEIELKKQIGEGGSNSVVYQASWKNQVIAFKSFKTRQVCESQDCFDEFEREVEILGSVNHPHILRFYGCSLKPPRVGILMEYCERGDLSHFLKKYKVSNNDVSYPIDEKIRLCNEIVLALDYLHSRKIIHRDLKLENVLLDKSESCKVMDFGLSRMFDELSQNKTTKIGTSIFMSPEIVNSNDYSFPVDVFSFSMMLYIIFTERYFPYGGSIRDQGGTNLSHIEIRVALNPQLRPNLSVLDKSLPPSVLEWIKPLIVKGWSHDPGYRPTFSQLSSTFKSHLQPSNSIPQKQKFLETRKIDFQTNERKVVSTPTVFHRGKDGKSSSIIDEETRSPNDKNDIISPNTEQVLMSEIEKLKEEIERLKLLVEEKDEVQSCMEKEIQNMKMQVLDEGF